MTGSSIAILPLLVLILAVAVAVVGVGIYLIRSSGSRRGPEPRCGNCGYNLTGSESNRCSECGLLFIDAGIVRGSASPSRARRRVGIALILVPVVLVLGLIPTTLAFRMAAAQRQRAVMAQQAALMARDRAEELKALAEAAAQADGEARAQDAGSTTASANNDSPN